MRTVDAAVNRARHERATATIPWLHETDHIHPPRHRTCGAAASCYPCCMAADDNPSPFDRIDSALARLEAAAAALPRPAPPAVAMPDPDLIKRHDALRSSVAAAIAALDQLLAQDAG